MPLPDKKTNDIRIVCIELWLMFSKYDIYLSKWCGYNERLTFIKRKQKK